MKPTLKIALSCWLAFGSVSTEAQVTIVPPGSTVAGLTLEEWSAEWWRWSLAIPCSTHPGFSTNDSLIYIGQTNPVFFLMAAASFGGQDFVTARQITISPDQYVFLPILNWANDNVGRGVALSADELRAEVYDWYNAITEISASINGYPVPDAFSPRYLLDSPVFSYTIPLEDNVYTCSGFTNLTNVDAEGVVNPAVAGGYWIMLAPLPPGSYVIRAKGSVGDPINISFEALYYLEVEPRSLADQIQQLRNSVVRRGIRHDQSLLACLDAANSSFENNRFRPGINQMLAFQHKVKAALGKEHPSLANEFMQAAQQIIDHAASKSK